MGSNIANIFGITIIAILINGSINFYELLGYVDKWLFLATSLLFFVIISLKIAGKLISLSLILAYICLLYTSDAADEEDSVDLGGRRIIKKVHKKTLANPRILICVPTGSTPVERKAIQDSALAAGARRVQLIEEPIAAAIGAGLPIQEATGSMVVDIGGGTTEIAVMSLGGVVYSESLRIAGDAMDNALKDYMREEYNLMIGDSTAEKIKKDIGTAIPTNNNTYAVKGRDLRSGTPKEVNISEQDTSEALNPILKEIVSGIKKALENTPPELSADLVDMGLTMTGGGSLLKNIDKRFSKETGLPVNIADDPLSCVAIGTGKALDDQEIFSTVLSEY